MYPGALKVADTPAYAPSRAIVGNNCSAGCSQLATLTPVADLPQQAIADELGMPLTTVNGWTTKTERDSRFVEPPESRQHFDVWQFATDKSKGRPASFGVCRTKNRPLLVGSQPSPHQRHDVLVVDRGR